MNETASLAELVRARIVNKRIRATIRGMLSRALGRGEVVKLSEVTRRVCARYPDDLDEITAERFVREEAEGYTTRTRWRGR